jgi:hypothetical protein
MNGEVKERTPGISDRETTPMIPGVSRLPGLLVAVIVALVAALGSLGGGYIGSHQEKTAQYELWSPESLNPGSQGLFVFKMDTATGRTWRMVEVTENSQTRMRWSLIADPPPPTPTPTASPPESVSPAKQP